jgi:MurNAc alpha-1-phosphate uridylyltransferase
MGPLTRTRPKPLIAVAGKPLIDHALDLAALPGITRKVVNLHYLGDQIATHLKGRGLILSWERDLILDTGGGLRAAAPLLGPGPALTLNTDAVWTGANPLAELMAAWDGTRMDALLLLAPASRALGHSGNGDFLMDDQGLIARAAGQQGLIYLGAQIVKPELLKEIPETVFSMNLLWDRLIARGRAFGLVHRGGWCDVGRPEGIALAEGMLASWQDE